jgi:hypothetical protein
MAANESPALGLPGQDIRDDRFLDMASVDKNHVYRPIGKELSRLDAPHPHHHEISEMPHIHPKVDEDIMVKRLSVRSVQFIRVALEMIHRKHRAGTAGKKRMGRAPLPASYFHDRPHFLCPFMEPAQGIVVHPALNIGRLIGHAASYLFAELKSMTIGFALNRYWCLPQILHRIDLTSAVVKSEQVSRTKFSGTLQQSPLSLSISRLK